MKNPVKNKESKELQKRVEKLEMENHYCPVKVD